MRPGVFLACAIRSARVLCGDPGGVTNTNGKETTGTTGTMSVAGLKGRSFFNAANDVIPAEP